LYIISSSLIATSSSITIFFCSFINSVKLLPSSDGGFYMLANRNRRVGSVSTEPWQISRFDSLGIRRWVREFTYTYAFGNPKGGEILPNGNLFVTGWAGREIYGLEIDTIYELKRNMSGFQKYVSDSYKNRGVDSGVASELTTQPGLDEIFSLTNKRKAEILLFIFFIHDIRA
jgi:outer membrane protein assembly factor BamB